MKIVWEQSVYVNTAPIFCTLCGQATRPLRSGSNQMLIGVLYNYQGIVCGEVCHHCIALGAEGIQSMLDRRIGALRTKLFELEAIAQHKLQLPSVEQEFRLHRRDGN